MEVGYWKGGKEGRKQREKENLKYKINMIDFFGGNKSLR